jgi:hypothetical protein
LSNVGRPVVSSDLDPFSDEFLSDPYPSHQILREDAPVLRLSKYGIWVMARYEQVSAALNDWQTFCSGRGVGLADFSKEAPWRPPSLLLEVDPPIHDRTREVIRKIISRKALLSLKPEWERIANELVDSLVARETFDGVKDLAEVYPLRVFPDAVGMPEQGRENLLPYGAMAFDAFGPRNERTERSMERAAGAAAWVAGACKRAALKPGGFGAQIYDAADRGEVSEEEAERLVRSFLTAGVDTTVNGLGSLLLVFAQAPDQWEALQRSPDLVPQVFDEVLRLESTVQTFFRTTTRDVDIEGVRVPAGEKVLLLLAAANRDPRKWENADGFDIRRRAGAHLGFGMGIHGCVGQMVARHEAELILRALLRSIKRISLNGPPQRRLNNTLRALASLPLAVQCL